MAVVLLLFGRLAYQWLTSEPPADPPPTLQEQADAIPAVESIEVSSRSIPGSPSRSVSAVLVLGNAALTDPEGTAAELAAVTWGWSQSDWRITGSGSTAQVNLGQPDGDGAPIAWWLAAAAALEKAGAGTIACTIRTGLLTCDVSSDTTAASVRSTLADAPLDGAAVQAWLDAADPPPEQEKGFRLRMPGSEITDPTAVDR